MQCVSRLFSSAFTKEKQGHLSMCNVFLSMPCCFDTSGVFFVFQCAKTFLNLMAHISKEQTVQYILTLIDDTLQVKRQIHYLTQNNMSYKKIEILKSLFDHEIRNGKSSDKSIYFILFRNMNTVLHKNLSITANQYQLLINKYK